MRVRIKFSGVIYIYIRCEMPLLLSMFSSPLFFIKNASSHTEKQSLCSYLTHSPLTVNSVTTKFIGKTGEINLPYNKYKKAII